MPDTSCSGEYPDMIKFCINEFSLKLKSHFHVTFNILTKLGTILL